MLMFFWFVWFSEESEMLHCMVEMDRIMVLCY